MINMGLSSKLVSGDGFDWSQGMVKSGGVEIPRRAAPAQRVRLQQQKQRQQPAPQQQGPQLKCPRCDSNTTKFCYYNNYSRAQPRYFCKACRRHWTEGGTLRNVPVGGGRKAKRPKTSHPSSAADPAAGAGLDNRVDNGITVPASTPPPPPLQLLPPLSFAEDILCPALLKPSLAPSTYANSSYNLGSLLSLPSTPQFVGSAAAGGMLDAGGYPFSTSPTIPSFLNLTGQEDLPAICSVDTALTASSMAPAPPPPWELLPPPTCSGGLSGSSIATTSSDLTALDSSSPSSGAGYWGNCWEDLTSFLSTDLDHPPASEAPALHQYFELS